MTRASNESLLAQLATITGTGGNHDAWDRVAASEPAHAKSPDEEQQLDALLGRVKSILGQKPAAASQAESKDQAPAKTAVPPAYCPVEPDSFRAAGLTDSEVEALVLKFLLARGDSSGREIADQVKLPFVLIDALLRALKNDQLIGHRGAAPMNDFVYQLSDVGRERARRFWAHCTYFGAAPVALKDYVASIHAQSLTIQQPSETRLRAAFADLSINEHMLNRLGPAVNSGRGLFLYGSPGNGKTSIAERVTGAFGQEIWIPRSIGIDGEILRVYDPALHEELPLEACEGLYEKRKIDRRWIRIRRPTIVVGGELTLQSLEVSVNTSTGICEAPLQMKSNCGTLVIDDFGRQRVRVDELLNRWIVPLERRFDFLNLPNGKKIEVPFDQLIIFSTNLEPADLVDEAFLRRIPYKIEVSDPTLDEFKDLFRTVSPKLGVEYREAAVDYLVERYYTATGRPLRFCHPRDLLMQIRSFCAYKNQPPVMTSEYFDMAVENYFAIF